MNGHEQYDRALMLATGAHAEDPESFGELAAVTQDFATALHIFAEELYGVDEACNTTNRMNALSGELDRYSQWLRDEAKVEKAEATP